MKWCFIHVAQGLQHIAESLEKPNPPQNEIARIEIDPTENLKQLPRFDPGFSPVCCLLLLISLPSPWQMADAVGNFLAGRLPSSADHRF